LNDTASAKQPEVRKTYRVLLKVDHVKSF